MSQAVLPAAFSPEPEPDACAARGDACAACGGMDRRPWEALDGTDGRDYRLHVCRDCGTWGVLPLPGEADLTAYYQEYARLHPESNGIVDSACFFANGGAVHERGQVLRAVLRRLGGKRPRAALDVGCGHGFFLAALKARGIPATGIDLDAAAVARARRWFGVDAHEGSLDEKLPLEDPELITAFEVLEHQRDPLRLAQQIRDRLPPGGWFAGSVPNAGGVGARLHGTRWRCVTAPRHLVYFNERSLARLLERAGFEVVFVGTIRPFAAPNFTWRLRRSLVARAERAGSPLEVALLQGLHRSLTWAKRRIVYGVLNLLVMGLRLGGDNVLFVARRPRA